VDLDFNQMNLDADGLADHGLGAEQAAAAEPIPVPVVKPWEKALDIALNIADPADRKTMVYAAIAMRDAFNKAEGKAKSQTTSKKPPRSVALPTSVPTQSAEPIILSAMQAKRAITQQGCASFLVYVSLQDGATAESSPPPPPEQTPESDIQMRFSSSSTGTDLEIILQAVLHDLKDVFATELPTGVPQDRNAFETIPLEPGAVPPYRPMYRLSSLQIS
jgi:hypothetical protein